MVFTRRRPAIPPLNTGSRTVEPSDDAKYLGIYLDKRLNWEKHFKHIKKKTMFRIHQLYPIFTSQSIPLQKKTHLYKALIRSSMLYGAPVWCNAPKRFLNSLQILQNKMARMSTGADIYTRISLLQTLFETPYIGEVIQALTQKTQATIKNSTNPLINTIT